MVIFFSNSPVPNTFPGIITVSSSFASLLIFIMFTVLLVLVGFPNSSEILFHIGAFSLCAVFLVAIINFCSLSLVGPVAFILLFLELLSVVQLLYLNHLMLLPGLFLDLVAPMI